MDNPVVLFRRVALAAHGRDDRQAVPAGKNAIQLEKIFLFYISERR